MSNLTVNTIKAIVIEVLMELNIIDDTVVPDYLINIVSKVEPREAIETIPEPV